MCSLDRYQVQAFIVFFISMILYYGIVVYLYILISPYWVWGLYLSPIFVTFVFISCILYVTFQKSKKNASDSEEDFCLTLVILSIMLMWWPIFLIIYFQIFNPLLIPFHQQKGELVTLDQIQYYSEQYTILIFNISDELAYGCQSSNYQASITDSVLPYKFKEIENELTNIKLPSWFCGEFNSTIPSILYLSNYIPQYDLKIVTFEYPNYISKPFFIAFVALIFQCACIFTSVLILSLLLITSQEHSESVIRKPSTQRRMFQFISSFSLYIMIISTNNMYLVLSQFIMGTLFLIASFSSKIHHHLYYLLEGLMKFINQSILQRIFYSLIFLILCILYGVFVLIAAQCAFHFKIYLARHFVALWYGESEEPLNKFDSFINKLTIIYWLWIIVQVILIFTLEIPFVQQIIVTILCLIQLIQFPYVLITKESTIGLFQQQWKIYYTQYKVLQQTEDDQPRQMREIELQFNQ